MAKAKSVETEVAMAPAAPAPVDPMVRLRRAEAEAKFVKQELRKHYMKEEKIAMYLSPMYQPYFGRVMNVSINGVHIYMPVDGSTHKIPKSFACEIARRRMAIDNILQKQRRMADVSRNNDVGGPGELKLF